MEVTDPIVRVERGQATILDCPPIKSYPPPMVQWLTDDGTQLYDIKYASVAETHQLVVLSVSDNDQKAYRSIEKTYEIVLINIRIQLAILILSINCFKFVTMEL